MTREELKKEAEEWLNKWELCNKCENKVDCISNFSYCKKVVLQSYLASAEPREKRIEDLEKENAELKSRDCWKSCEYANPKAELIEQHIKDVQNLIKAKELIRTLLLIADNKVSQMEFQLCVADAKQFLSEVEK